MADELCWKCQECGKEFESGAHLGNHLKKPHPPKTFLQRLRSIPNSSEASTGSAGYFQRQRSSGFNSLARNVSQTNRARILRSSVDEVIRSHEFEKKGIKTSDGSSSVLPVQKDCHIPDKLDLARSAPQRKVRFQNVSFDRTPEDNNDTSVVESGSNRASDEERIHTSTATEQERYDDEQIDISTEVSGPPPIPSALTTFSIGQRSLPMSWLETSETELYDRSIPRDVHDFYKSFGDKTEVMFRNLKDPQVPLEILPETCRLLVNYCMRRRMPQSEMKEQYYLQLSLEELYKLPHSQPSSIGRHFRDANAFASFVVAERQRVVWSQGWKKATIINDFGIEQVGVLLPITTVLRRVVSEAGGTDHIREFRTEYNDLGERTFSCPLDSEVLKVESEVDNSPISRRQKLKKVFFSMYCDETLLSKSGSQDAAIVRIRVENVEGSNLVWHDVGIPPKLIIGNGSVSKARRRQAKLELFHRFIFLILEEIAAVNIHKVSEQLGFVPVLLGFVADQPQERVFLCLKRGNCQQDCSFCCFRSAEDRSARKQKRDELETCNMDCSKMQELHQKRRGEKTAEAEWQSDVESDDEEGLRKHEGIPIPEHIDRYVPRDVYSTVKLQLQAAVLTRLKSIRGYSFRIEGVNSVDDHEGLARKKELLAVQGALPLPPAFACLQGICSSPNRLYTLPTIDLLHCFDLGPSKQFCDEAFLVFRRPPYASKRIRSGFARIANQRVADLPSDTDCHGMRPFKLTDTDKQASYTGKERRVLCPVLWAVTMGLCPSMKPDEDPLFQAALYLDFMQAELKGINRAVETRRRTLKDIEELQNRCIEACNHFIECFEANESTKIHRLMVHLGAHLEAYGNLRVSDTGRNETLHRGVKASYLARNKRQSEIAPQLLQVNISAEFLSTPDCSAAENHLLLTRDPVTTFTHDSKGETHFVVDRDEAKREEKVALEVSRFIDGFYKKTNNENSPEWLVKALMKITDGFARYRYTRKKRVSIRATFEWNDQEVYVRQTLYANASIARDTERFDCVRYEVDNKERFGMVQAFLTRLPTRRRSELAGCTVALIRKLRTVDAEEGNRLIVDKFGYCRVAFESFGSDIEVECIPLSSITRRIVVVRDMWDVAHRYGPEKRVPELPDTAEERISARFFIAKNVKFTSIGEELLIRIEDTINE